MYKSTAHTDWNTHLCHNGIFVYAMRISRFEVRFVDGRIFVYEQVFPQRENVATSIAISRCEMCSFFFVVFRQHFNDVYSARLFQNVALHSLSLSLCLIQKLPATCIAYKKAILLRCQM